MNREDEPVKRVTLVAGILCVVAAVIVFVFADGLRRWYSGIFFAVIAAVMLARAARAWRAAPPGGEAQE